MKNRRCHLVLSCLALSLITSLRPASAETAGTLPVTEQASAGVSGRIQNAATGQYLNNARISVKGTNLVAFSDDSGTYRIERVPSGPVLLEVFFTGMDPQQIRLMLVPGSRVEQDFGLSAPTRPTDASQVVQLSSFVVSDSREMDGAAIAINEQRFAPNIINVVSADEFGIVPDGNVGEFLKLLPGITMSYRGGDPREISINGVSSDNVPVTVGGFSLATPEVSGTGRNVELNSVSINNMSRVEAVYSPTPESPGSALAGSVNLVPRSAFERAKPLLSTSVYIAMRDDARDFHRTPGPRREPTRKVHPGFEFSWVVPVNQRFGFTISGGASAQYSSEPFMQNTWRGGGSPANGTTLPDTTPDRPYLSDYLVRDSTVGRDRSSLGATVDFRLSRTDRVSFSFQYGTFHSYYNQRNLTFMINRVLPGQFSPTHTHGFAGAGEVRQNNNARDRLSRTYMPSLTYRHDGAVWKAELGLGLSNALNRFRDADRGYFSTTLARRTGVTVAFDDIFYLRPERITVTDGASGAPVDPYSLSSYTLNTSGGNVGQSISQHRTAFANLRRDFDGRWPLALKGGIDLRHSSSEYRTRASSFTFVGADGRTSTTPMAAGSDDGAAVVLDQGISQRTGPYGFPQIQWVSNEAVWDLYNARPGYFTLNENNQYRSEISNSKHSEELISSVYVRGDLRLFNGRLRLVGGLRAEQTNVEAQGPLTDPTRNYQRDASGRVLLAANGRPLTIASDALSISKLTFIDRGLRAEKEYLRLLPSINASFNVRENIIARAAYYHSLGRPNFNQYSGGLTLPDVESAPGPSNRIVVNNAGIKAWQARSAKLTLEYYFERVGQLSVGVFRREFKNFFGSTMLDATPAFLALYGLDPLVYDSYDVATQHNVAGLVRMQGLDVNYRQALTFLPGWARGVQVYANGSVQRATGDAAANFSGYIPRSGSWGVSLSRPKYNLRLNWNYLGRQRRGIVNGRSIDAGTYTWGSKRSYIDLTGEYSFRRNFALFANLRNINDPVDDVEIAGPNTPAHAQLRQRTNFGSLWTIGIKSSF
ncbi:MAG: TonB-dependent receptor plug domain-containing protein [Opitutaceae bacterium]|nr:TonB-dependent receptor plug domain-containing protein [Opitutaceae bacterium]